MDKALELLEAHCQWLAVALGGIFLAWMLWAYVLMTPVAVPGGPNNTELTPGSVDDAMGTAQAEPLRTQIETPGTLQPPSQISTPAVEPFIAALAGTDVKFPPVPQVVINSPSANVQLGPEVKGPGKNAVLVTALPKLPPAQIVEALPKKAHVGPPVAVASAAAPPPDAPPPAVVPAAAGVPAAAAGKDLVYVRVSYNLDTPAISKAFDDVKIPQGIAQTGVVGIKLMRQEQAADGTWSAAVEVPYLKTGVQTFPPPLNNVGVVQTNNFRTWSDSPQGMTDLLRPTFYPVLAGEGPWDPSMDDTMPAYDPLIEQKKKQQEYIDRQKAKAAAAPRPSGPPSRGSSGRRGREGGEPAAPDPQRPASVGGLIGVQYPGAGAPRNVPPPPPPGDNPDGTAPGQPPAAVQPGQGQPPQQPLPAPQFQPSGTPPILSWAYDETVAEGHTYRYQVVYALRSPVYNSNITNPPNLAQVFTIWSEPDDNAWGQPVYIKPTAEFYLAGTNWQGDRIPSNIKIEVFKWAGGKWQLKPFNVFPGDEIGDMQDNVDYGTNVTVVDLRYDPRGNNGRGRAYVLLLTPDGKLEEREPTADRNNPRMNQLRGVVLANQPAAGAPGAPGGPPGAPPPPGSPGTMSPP